MHARKAWLAGLSPKQNREVPPLRYELVHRLKADFPALAVIVNGGLQTPAEAVPHLARLDGVMLGRAAYHDPYGLAAWERLVYGAAEPPPSRAEIARRLLPYVERERAAGTPLKAITRHILGLFNGQPGARAWRRQLSEAAHRQGAGPEVIEAALARLPAEPRAAA